MGITNFLPGSRTARKMVLLASLAQNCSVGLVLGSYGALIPSIENTFDTTRAVSTLGYGGFALVAGLMAPVVGWLLRQLSVRTIFAAGAVIHILGYLGLALAPNLTAFLIIFALFIGTGTAMMAVIAPPTLVSRWYREARGRALGLVNLPIFLIVIPPIAAAVVTRYGLTTWFLGAAVLFALLLPIMLMIVDEPDQVGELAHGALATPEGTVEPPTIRMAAFLANPQFWLLTLGVGFSTGAGGAFLTHIVPFAKAEAISIQSASLLVTVYGVAGLVGNLVLGGLADRLGAVITLGICTLCQSLLWLALLLVNGFPMLVGVAALMGMFTASMLALHGAAVNELFGYRNVSGALGLAYLFKLPFNFGAAPLAGYLFVVAASYSVPFGSFAAFLFAAALGFALLAVLRSGQNLQLQG